MNGSIITNSRIIAQIAHNYNKNDMISAIINAFKCGADMVRIGIRFVNNEFVIVSSEWEPSSGTPDGADVLLTANDLFDRFPDQLFNFSFVEEKPYLTNMYIDLITKNNAAGRVLTSSLYGTMINNIRNVLSDSVTAFSFMRVVGLYALYRSGLIYFKRKFSSQVVQTYESVGPSYIASQGFVRVLRSKGICVYVFIDEIEESICRLWEAGVSGFIVKKTDFIPRLIELMV